MKKRISRYISVILAVAIILAAGIQNVEANGVRVTTQHIGSRFKITLASQEKGMGLEITAFTVSNGKTINVAYTLKKGAAAASSTEIDESMVLAPFRVITTKSDDLNYRPFSDILGTEFDEYIRHIHDIGITSGFSDGTFRPSGTLSRAEAAAMLSVALNLKLDDSKNTKLKDVNNHWGRKYINAVLNKRIMTGYSDKTFRPNNKITVAEVCTIISKSFYFRTKSEGKYDKLRKKQWYSNYVQNIFNLKILTIEDSIYKNFSETSNISRGNFAMMLSRALSTY
ncbi:MAG TPA: S-layer homology domain-containing protein [Ruminiclostridium sp.]|nr:S-layer homology domain-containing protein [Ruminiclostridium sp.]